MRWDDLFADLEGQLERGLDTERQELAAEEERLRLARLGLRDRMLAMAHEGTLRLVLADGETLALRVGSTGRDWVAGDIALGTVRQAAVIPLAAVAAVLPEGAQLANGLRPASLPEQERLPDLAGRLGLAVVLRDLCRRRVGVELRTRAGAVHGTIDRVARDHLDLAEHERGEPRRDGVVRRIRLVPFDALLSVRV